MQSTTFVGNLTRDPELRHSQQGKARATFSIAINTGEGDNEKVHYVNFTAFGTLGENVAKSLVKGNRVIVTGRLDTYSKAVQVDGVEKNLTMTNFIANAVGPDLLWATADVQRVKPATSSGGSVTTHRAKDVEPDDAAEDAEPAKPKAKPRSGGRSKPAPVDDDEF